MNIRRLAIYLLTGLVTLLGGPRLVSCAELCTAAQRMCTSRMACGFALHNYFLNCGSLLEGETDECTTRCKKALISLLSTDDNKEGQAYMHCDCEGNTVCESHKSRMQVCSEYVLPAMKRIHDEDSTLSCSLAQLICRADTPCLTALQFANTYCPRLVRGERCTAKCNNSLSILYRQPKAAKLRTCVCDGSEDYRCSELQANTDRLCYGDHSHRHRHHTNSKTRDTYAPADGQTALIIQHNNDTTHSVDANAQYASVGSLTCGLHPKYYHTILLLFTCLLLTRIVTSDRTLFC